jgi:hypothetical protein
MTKVKVIIAKKKHECEDLLGKFLDESHYDILVNEDTDFYTPLDSLNEHNKELQIAFKFRKNFFSEEEQKQAYNGLRDAAQQSQNRGLAAGPKGQKLQGREWATIEQLDLLDYLKKLDDRAEITKEDIEAIKARAKTKMDTRGQVWLSSETKKENFNFEEWMTSISKKSTQQVKKEAVWILESLISDTTYANPVLSGIAGYFDRYPRIPYKRATSYTKDNFEKFKLAFPFLETLNEGYKKLLPWRWGNQRAAADKLDHRFLVGNTVFTTITVNNTFRTAAHRDAGDLHTGFSNLLVLSNDGRFTGGYLIIPEFRVAINVRPGDLLLINNHDCIHGNTPIIAEEGSERISLVCYFREPMISEDQQGSWEYEDLRYKFVEYRRLNKEHPGHKNRHLWNGIDAGMWDSTEWYNYLRYVGGETLYQEQLAIDATKRKSSSSLEALFG